MEEKEIQKELLREVLTNLASSYLATFGKDLPQKELDAIIEETYEKRKKEFLLNRIGELKLGQIFLIKEIVSEGSKKAKKNDRPPSGTGQPEQETAQTNPGQ